MSFLCPYCQTPVDMTGPDADHAVCPSCRSSFHLSCGPTLEWSPQDGQRRLGRFELIDRVGIGSFGTVYKARDTERDRIVALKVPRTISIGGRSGDSDHFVREARNVARLRHPSIVAIHEIGEHNGIPFIVEDFVAGITLADSLTTEQLSPRQTAELIAAIADALQYAHDQGIVHRDVKPSNIMLERRDEGRGARGEGRGGPEDNIPACLSPLVPRPSPLAPRLMDFGLARRLDGEVTLTVEGQVLGTPAYMSPEQARGEAHHVDGRSDIYSLGVILYQLLTKALPFQGNPRMQMHQVLNVEPDPPRKRAPSLPRKLETICLTAMAKAPARRYQKAADFAADLRRFLGGQSIQARRTSSLERAVKWSRRRPLVPVLAIGSALLLVSAAWLWNYERERRRQDEERRLADATRVEFFANVARRNGVLEGVGPLSAAQAACRYISYKLYRRAGKVEKMESVTGRGELSGKETHGSISEKPGRSGYIDDIRDRPDQWECRYEYRYNDRGEITEEVAYDPLGHILWIFHYTAHRGHTSTGHFTDELGFPRPRAASGAVYVAITRSAEGWDREIRYLDGRSRPAPIQDGSYGLEQECDERGLPVRQSLLDAAGRPMLGRNGYAAVRLSYDELGQQHELTYLALDGRPTANSDGIASIRQAFDGAGNAVELAWFGADGRPMLTPHGYARVNKTYDARGSTTGWRFYGLDGQPTLHRRWQYAETRLTLSARGLTLEQIYYGVDGQPTVTSPGVTKYINTYDDLGNQTSYASFGLDRRPVADSAGVAKTVYSLDERGNRIREEYFGVDGRPVCSHGVFAAVSHAFDDHSRETEWAFFDIAGKPMRHPEGYSRARRTFDPHGREIEIAYLDIDGKPAVMRQGYASLRRTYDERGNITGEAYFGPEGKPALAPNGFSKITRTYNEAGELRQVRYFDAQDQPLHLDFIRDWLVLAPIPLQPGQSPEAALLAEPIPHETRLRPREGDKVRIGANSLTWQKHRSPEFFLDFNRVLDPLLARHTEYSLGYGICYLMAQRARKDLLLKVGSDDQVLVRLNGREILKALRPRSLLRDEDVIPIALDPGANVLLLKVANETRDWSACVRLTDTQGNPLMDVCATTSPSP